MPTRFILVKFCRPTLIQKVWVCGLVVQVADLWGMYAHTYPQELREKQEPYLNKCMIIFILPLSFILQCKSVIGLIQAAETTLAERKLLQEAEN